MKVLIADDEKLICEGMCAILAAIPNVYFETRSVNSVAQGKQELKWFKPDIVISDIEMPGPSGLTLVEYVRGFYAGTRVLILSGHDDFNYVRTAFKLQVDDYLLKPIDVAKFQELMKRIYVEFQRDAASELAEEIYTGFFPEEPEKVLSPRLQELCEYIQRNYSKDVSLRKLSEVFSCSETFICNLFKQETGRTYLEFVNRVRVRNAFRYLLSRPHRCIHEIAVDLGYASERQFFRVFKGLTGVTPNYLREKYTAALHNNSTKTE